MPRSPPEISLCPRPPNDTCRRAQTAGRPPLGRGVPQRPFGQVERRIDWLRVISDDQVAAIHAAALRARAEQGKRVLQAPARHLDIALARILHLAKGWQTQRLGHARICQGRAGRPWIPDVALVRAYWRGASSGTGRKLDAWRPYRRLRKRILDAEMVRMMDAWFEPPSTIEADLALDAMAEADADVPPVRRARIGPA